MYQFVPNEPYRDLFWKIKKSEQNRVVLDVHRKNLYECLKHVSIIHSALLSLVLLAIWCTGIIALWRLSLIGWHNILLTIWGLL